MFFFVLFLLLFFNKISIFMILLYINRSFLVLKVSEEFFFLNHAKTSQSVCLSVCLSLSLPLSLSLSLSLSVFFCLSAFSSLSTSIFVCPSVFLFFFRVISLSCTLNLSFSLYCSFSLCFDRCSFFLFVSSYLKYRIMLYRMAVSV